MRTKCANCGEIKDIHYRWGSEGFHGSYALFFCYDCGEKIERKLKEGIN